MTWVHWVVHNIPADAESLPEGAAERSMPAGAVQGSMTGDVPATAVPARRSADIDIFTSSTQSTLYCPVLDHPTKAQLLNALKGHVLADAQLVGTYQKGG